jgi:putative peptide zinc metalloprotease protein
VPSTVTFQAILPDGTRVAVSDEWAIVGRHASNDIVLTDGSVSRKHAKVRRTGSSFEIVDLGSSNGTHYSGDHILPSIEIALALGETHRVDFGTVTVIFGLKG